jgi:hypothetical protein
VSRQGPRQIRQRIGRVGDGDQNRIRRGVDDPRDNVAVDRGILVQQLQPPFGVAAVGGAAGFLVDAGGDQHHPGARQVAIPTFGDADARTQRDAITQIRRDSLGPGRRAVDDHDLPRAVAQDECHETGRPDPACSDDSDLHVCGLLTLLAPQRARPVGLALNWL